MTLFTRRKNCFYSAYFRYTHDRLTFKSPFLIFLTTTFLISLLDHQFCSAKVVPPPTPGGLPQEIASKVHNVPISTEHGLELYQHWIDQALGSLFAAVANKRLKEYPKNVQNEFGACSKDAKTIPLHAKCVSKLLKNEFSGKNYDDYEDERVAKSKSSRLELYSTKVANNLIKEHGHRFHNYKEQQEKFQKQQKHKQHNKQQNGVKITGRLQKFAPPGSANADLISAAMHPSKKPNNWVGGFRVYKSAQKHRDAGNNNNSARLVKLRKLEEIVRRAKRENIFDAGGENNGRQIVSRSRYALKTASGGLTPLGSVAKLLMKTVLSAKNKTEVKPWQHVIQGVRDMQKKRKAYKKHLKEDSLENMDQFAFRGLKSRGLISDDDLEEAIESPDGMKKFLTKKRREKVNDPSAKLMNFLREGFKIAYALSGRNTTEADDKNMKFVSPRFLSVLPEDDDEKNSTLDFLSPSLFSLHNNGKGVENLTSLPSLINGFSSKDQQEWMNLIIEAADVQEHVEKFEEEMTGVKEKTGITLSNREKYERESRAKDGTPLYFTKENATAFGEVEVKKINIFEKLERTYTKEQIKQLNTTGFSLMSRDQMMRVYGPGSPYYDAKRLKLFLSLNESTFERVLEEDVHHHASDEMESFKLRQKDIIGSPIVLTPIVLNPRAASQAIVLSPLVLTPVILSPAVLGPIIVSPWLFVPVIVSPRILSPLIVSPFVLAPVVLSPLILHPLILSPGVLDVAVLTPIVLSPIILSPLVFVPLILSPLVLSPFILSPALGSPLVLSPFVLSPIILSPQVLSALVLSPYAASPIILTPLIAFSVVLSPSWLS